MFEVMACEEHGSYRHYTLQHDLISHCRPPLHSQRRTTVVFVRLNTVDQVAILGCHLTRLDVRIVTSVTTTSLAGRRGRQRTQTHSYQLPHNKLAGGQLYCVQRIDDMIGEGQFT